MHFLVDLNVDFLVTQGQAARQPHTPNEWNVFCDFPEITHIVIGEANVCISTQDNRCMVRLLVLLYCKSHKCSLLLYLVNVLMGH